MSSLLRPLLLAALAVGLALPAVAQVQLQVIHNAADPAAAEVDVYVNGALTLDDFAFRTATPFLDLPADTDLAVAIAPGSSSSADDAVFTQTYNLPEGAYQLIASGVLSPGDFANNPDGAPIGFRLIAGLGAHTASPVLGQVDLRIVHGATDAPSVDVVTRGTHLANDVSYGDVSPYLQFAPDRYVIEVQTAGGAPVAEYVADLSGASGRSLIVLASGFLDPSANQDGPAFGLLAVFADGTAAVLPAAPARLQVIHNAADPAAAEVDVYVNGDLLLDDFAFRTATPFIDVPSNTDLEVAVAPGTSTGAGDAVFTETFNLPGGSTTQLVANGVLAPDAFADNPDGIATAFTLLVGADAREDGDGDVAVRVVHGATDAPTVDVRSGGAVLVDDASYRDVTGYLSVPPDDYVLDVTLADGTPVASFLAPLSVPADTAVTVLASGFLAPDANQGGEAFGLLAIFPDGTAALLPVAVDADDAPAAEALSLGAPAPNPLRGRGTVSFSLDAPGAARLALYDALGREVAVLADDTFSADAHQARLDTRALASGVYVLRLQAPSGVRSQTLTVVR